MIQFDCHAHVFETTRAVPGARYAPKAPAPLAAWLKNLENHDLKGGVLVQVSFLGTDNSELCTALSKLDISRFAGVAVVPLGIEDSELVRLTSLGVRGVRWNLVRGAPIPDLTTDQVQAFLAKLRKHNLHLEVHLEGDRLAVQLESLADQGVPIVIDHFGLPTEPLPTDDPFIKAVGSLKERNNLFIKLSARYRTKFDLTPHMTCLTDLLSPDQTLWGSDWPHTQHETSVDYGMAFQDAGQTMTGCGTNAAEQLYGIEVT